MPRRTSLASPTPATPRCSASRAYRWDSPEQVADAWEEVLAADCPVFYEAITDPEVPPLPPHIRFEQAKQMPQALAKGDPSAMRIVKQSLKGKLQELSTR
jgi:pyruvate dehydrogenase (quinone)